MARPNHRLPQIGLMHVNSLRYDMQLQNKHGAPSNRQLHFQRLCVCQHVAVVLYVCIELSSALSVSSFFISEQMHTTWQGSKTMVSLSTAVPL